MMNSPERNTPLLEDRFARKVAFRLSQTTNELPHDISERLRAARVQALSQRKVAQTQTAVSVIPTGSSAALTWDAEETLGWWGRIGLILPLVILVVGLLAINSIQDDRNAREVAEVDSALLTDELPPAAFADPGFVQFLKNTRQATAIE